MGRRRPGGMGRSPRRAGTRADRRAAADRRVGRRAARRHRRGGHGQDPRHRRAGAAPARDAGRGGLGGGGRRRSPRRRGDRIPAEPGRHDPPFAGPLAPEQILVLTYNVKAAKELSDRLEAALGPTTKARLAGPQLPQLLPPGPDRARRRGRPDRATRTCSTASASSSSCATCGRTCHLVYHSSRGGDGGWWLGQFVAFINRAKDELVTPDQVDAFAAAEQAAFEERHGPLEPAIERLRTLGNLAAGPRGAQGLRALARDARRPSRRRAPRATRSRSSRRRGRSRRPPTARPAGRWTARATRGRSGRSATRSSSRSPSSPATYVVDGAALEVLRLRELALVYRAYQEELHRRGALDFGEQIAAVIRLFRERPNVLRRYQRQFRYILVDEFQDANVAQIELVELLGRTPDRPDNVMVVGDDDQSIYRFRGASYAAFAELDRRFALPPIHDPDAPPPGPPTRMRLEENHRSGGHVLTAANRLIEHNVMRFEPDKRLVTRREGEAPVELVVCAGPDDEAVTIVDRIRELAGGERRGRERTRRRGRRSRRLVRLRDPLPQAPPPRGDRRPAARGGHPVHRRRRAVAVRGGRDPRPRADPPRHRRPAPGRRPGPDAVGRPVAAGRARDADGRPDRALRPAPPHRGRARDRRVGRGRVDRPGVAPAGRRRRAGRDERARRGGTSLQPGRSTCWRTATIGRRNGRRPTGLALQPRDRSTRRSGGAGPRDDADRGGADGRRARATELGAGRADHPEPGSAASSRRSTSSPR